MSVGVIFILVQGGTLNFGARGQLSLAQGVNARWIFQVGLLLISFVDNLGQRY